MGDFDELSDRVFKLYASGEHASALSLAESGFEQFDARRSELDALSSALDSLQARTPADSLRTAEPVADLSARRA